MRGMALFIMVGWLGVASAFSQSTVSTVEAWKQLQAVVKEACDVPEQAVLVDWDQQKDLLKVGQDTTLNQISVFRQIQVVPVSKLDPEVPIEGMQGVPNPWVKIRCLDDRRVVSITTVRVVEGAPDDASEEEKKQAFVVVPCKREKVKQLRDAFQAFLKAAQSKN